MIKLRLEKEIINREDKCNFNNWCSLEHKNTLNGEKYFLFTQLHVNILCISTGIRLNRYRIRLLYFFILANTDS